GRFSQRLLRRRRQLRRTFSQARRSGSIPQDAGISRDLSYSREAARVRKSGVTFHRLAAETPNALAGVGALNPANPETPARIAPCKVQTPGRGPDRTALRFRP